MRFLNTLANDIRYQVKYGFYFLYAFISTIYIVLLLVIPSEYKKLASSIIILTDPAMLGMFFIGGIWLLEKEEGLHKFWEISPLRPMEYVISKAVSLSVISTISANLILLIGLRETINYFLLSVSVFKGSMLFTVIGLLIASYARSVNHYMLIASLPATFLSAPPILAAFGVTHPVLEIFPGMALWCNIRGSIDISSDNALRTWPILLLWLVIALKFACIRIPIASIERDGKT